jgi:hypothetical protein
MEGSLQKNERDEDFLHISVVCSIKVPAGLEIRSGYKPMNPPLLAFFPSSWKLLKINVKYLDCARCLKDKITKIFHRAAPPAE